jgi:hypothetical protein
MIDAVQVAQRDIFGVPRANTHTLAQHDWILEALRQGDVGETARRVRDHLTPTFNFPAMRHNSRSTAAAITPSSSNRDASSGPIRAKVARVRPMASSLLPMSSVSIRRSVIGQP